MIADRRDWVAEFLTTRRVQTNEVQRTWALLPAFLSLGESRLDLLELGPSAGLNLVWDRYRYRYQAGRGGRRELAGEERAPVPAELLERPADIVRRRGVDLVPVDATTDEGALSQVLCLGRSAGSSRAVRIARSPGHAEEEAGLSSGYELEVGLRPERGPTLIARTGYHGQWLEWQGLDPAGI